LACYTTQRGIKDFQEKVKNDKSQIEYFGKNRTRKIEKGWYNFPNQTFRMAFKSCGS
jgi:hypothetical protein